MPKDTIGIEGNKPCYGDRLVYDDIIVTLREYAVDRAVVSFVRSFRTEMLKLCDVELRILL
jgi:hypothetical protein